MIDIDDEAEAIVTEAIEKAIAIRKLFFSDARGMMICAYTLHIFLNEYPSLAKTIEKAPDMIGQWLAAGKPENLNEVPKILMKKAMENQANGVHMPEVREN
jgi:hypothetical protein